MTQLESALHGEQRDDILRAVAAIERQLKVMGGKPQPHTQSLWVVGTNLTLIRASLTDFPRASSN